MKVLWRLKSYGLRYKRRLAVAYLCILASAAGTLTIPRLLGIAIDEVLESGLRSEQLRLAGLIVLIRVLKGAFDFGHKYLAESVFYSAAHDLRKEVFRRLMGLGFGFWDRQRTGDLMSRATQDVWDAAGGITLSMVRILFLAVLLTAVAGIMLGTNWRLAIIAMAFLSVYTWRSFTSRRGLWEIGRRLRAEYGDMAAVLQESLTGMRVAKAFDASGYEGQKSMTGWRL